MKKYFLSITLVFSILFVSAQKASEAPNVFIITIDGYRWQEVYRGADLSLMSDQKFVKDTNLIKEQFWSDDELERKKMLMPFFWNVIAKRGLLLGNRDFGNKVAVSNFYKISHSIHDPGLRHQQLSIWLTTNGDKCDSKQLVIIWNRLAEWGGASDSAELRGKLLYYFSRAEVRERKEKS